MQIFKKTLHTYLFVLIASYANYCDGQQNILQKVIYDQQLLGITSNFMIPNHNEAIIFGNGPMLSTFPNPLIGDGVIVKVDSSLNLKWKKTLGKSPQFYDAASSLDSSFAVIGNFTNNQNNINSAFCVKYKPNGDTAWSRTLALANTSLVPTSIASTNDSGFVISGLNAVTPYNNAFVIKINKHGALNWFKLILGISANDNIMTHAIKQTPDSGYVLIGGYASINGAFILKMNKVGNILWSKKINGINANYNTGMDLITEGKNLICAFDVGSPTLIRTDSVGNVISSNSFKELPSTYHHSKYFKLKNSKNNGFLVLVNNKSPLSIHTNYNTLNWLLETDLNFQIKSIHYHPMRSIDIVTLPNKSYIFSGNGPIHELAVKTQSVTCPQIGLIKSDSLQLTNYCFGRSFVNAQDSIPVISTINTSFTSTLGGILAANLVSTGTISLSTSNECVYHYVTGGLAENKSARIKVFPNPANNKINIETEDFLLNKKINVLLMDVTGKTVFNQILLIISETTEINCHNIPNGIYILKVGEEGTDIQASKIMITH